MKVYENRFIGRYDSLVYIDSDILPLQDADTNGNHIEDVNKQIQTDVGYIIFKEGHADAIATFENQLLSSCAFYAANHLQLSTNWSELPVECIDDKTGVYFGTGNNCIYERGIKNTMPYNR